MPPRPRLRKLVKWGGAGFVVFTTATWIASGFFPVRAGLFGAHLSDGGVAGQWVDTSLYPWTYGPWHPYFCVLDLPASFDNGWWFRLQKIGASAWGYSAPGWVLPLIASVPTAIAWRRDARSRRGGRACARCGYPLNGLAAGAACPECGVERTPAR